MDKMPTKTIMGFFNLQFADSNTIMLTKFIFLTILISNAH